MMGLVIAAAALAVEPPRAFVDRIYSNYKSADFSSLAHPERVFARPLASAINEDQRLADGEVGFLDGDPLCDCQDTGGMRARIVALNSKHGFASSRISVSFAEGPDRRDIRIKLILTRAGWRIADVRTPDRTSLLRALQTSNRRSRTRLPGKIR
jgi:hypothetical protein